MQEQHIYNLKEKMNKFEKVLTFKQKGFGREGGMKTRTEPHHVETWIYMIYRYNPVYKMAENMSSFLTCSISY